MSVMLRKLLAPVLIAVLATGCVSTRKETQTQTIKVKPTPQEARVWVKDETGQRFMDPGPAEISQRYDTEVKEFNEWWWASFAGSVVATTFGGLFIHFGKEGDAQFWSGISLASGGGVCTILSLIFCTMAQLEQGKSQPVSRKISVGADLDGYQTEKKELEIPSDMKEIILSLKKSDEPAKVAEPGLGPRRPIVAVFDVHDASGKIEKEVLDQLTIYLGTALMKTGEYKIVPRDQLRSRLLEEKKGTYKQCVDESCQIELGKVVAAQKSLATQLLQVGKKCAVTANLFDLKTETAEKGAVVNTGCTPDQLLEAMKQVAEQLSEK